MIVQPLQLRHALSHHLGDELTPERAAWIEAVAVANPMPMPHHGAVLNGLDITQDQRLFDFVNDAIGSSFEPSTSRAIARLGSDLKIRCAAVFSVQTKHSIEVSIASDESPGWLTRSFLHWMFFYAFEQAGVPRITAVVRSDNDRALKLNQHVGFKVEGCARKWYGDVDGILMGMLRHECGWLNGGRHG